MIRSTVTRRPEVIVDLSLLLWERLAAELISIIGESGFQSLYSRSVRLTNTRFPWLAISRASETDAPFAGLKASEASIAVLVTFIDTLSVLIGDVVTNSVLHSAWSTVGLDLDAKDFENE
jgi:hypothetical protein